MIDRKVLAAAQERNILTADQAEQLVRLAAETTGVDEVPRDNEPLRLVTGFSDIFIMIGISIFLWSGFALAAQMFSPAIAFALLAGAAWMLAEAFTLQRRQALPSLSLIGSFALCVFAASNLFLRDVYGDGTETTAQSIFYLFTSLHRLIIGFNGAMTPADIGAAAITAFAVALHYLRFRAPISIAMGGIFLVANILGILDWAFPSFFENAFRWLLLAAGLALFAAAMRFDLSDPERRTQRSDIAFWLHLYSAPMILNALVNPFLQGSGFTPFANPAGILLLAFMLAVVSLAIDRRAILFASLLSIGLMFGSVAILAGMFGFGLPIMFFIIGGCILFMGAGWNPMRKAVLQHLPESLVRRLPRPVG